MLSTRGPGLRVPRAPFLPAGAALADPDDGTMAGGVRVLAGVSTLLPSNHLRKAPQVTFPNLRSDSATPASVNSQGQNPGVGSLSLLQWIFPTQESNQGLLHCRWILYQLRYQGSPQTSLSFTKTKPTARGHGEGPGLPASRGLPLREGDTDQGVISG